LDAKWKLKERANDVLIYGSLRYYSDVQSEEAKLLKREAEELNSELTRELSFVDGKILALGKKIVDEHFEKEPRLEIYRHHLNDIFRKEEYVQNDETASQIKENSDSINGLLNSYNSLLRETEYGTIELEGETVKITAANFSRYISSRDRETRRQTYFAVNDAFIEKAPEFANILNSIYSFRTQNASIEGYSSVLEKSLFEENIDPQVIDDLIKTVLSNLDLMRRYLNIKSRLLGIEDPHLYDYTVPLDFGTLRKFSLEDAIKITKESLSFLGKDYSLAIDELLKGLLILKLSRCLWRFKKSNPRTRSYHQLRFIAKKTAIYICRQHRIRRRDCIDRKRDTPYKIPLQSCRNRRRKSILSEQRNRELFHFGF